MVEKALLRQVGAPPPPAVDDQRAEVPGAFFRPRGRGSPQVVGELLPAGYRPRAAEDGGLARRALDNRIGVLGAENEGLGEDVVATAEGDGDSLVGVVLVMGASEVARGLQGLDLTVRRYNELNGSRQSGGSHDEGPQEGDGGWHLPHLEIEPQTDGYGTADKRR